MSIIKSIRQHRLFTVRISSFDFCPGIISSLVTIALLYTMVSLGLWQLGRADFKQSLQEQIEQRKGQPVSSLDELTGSTEDRRFLPVSFTAEYDVEHSFLLDNKIFNGRVGYHVYTPVKISEGRAILVARGFIDIGESREQLPDFDTPEGVIAFSGLLDLPPSKTLVLAENVQQTERWPVVLQYIDLDEISRLSGYEFYDMVLWLKPDSAEDIKQKNGSLEYDLPVLNLNAAKNNGYAFQWFAMSLALLIIYIVVNTKRHADR
jgi:surfeit locus 1 family protein